MKKTFVLLPFAIILFALGLPLANAEECVKPKDCYSQECAGLPSYPTFQFEACLTQCNATYWDRVNAYDTCVANQQTQQNMQQAQDQQPAQQNTYSEPAPLSPETPNVQPGSNLIDETATVTDLKVGKYLKSKPGQRLTVPLPEGTMVMDESSTVQKLKDGWKLVKGRLKLIIDKLGKARRFKVTSANAVAGVRGTQFLMDHKSNKTTIRVLEGAVEVTDKKGKNKVDVKAGFQTVVNKGKKPSNPTTFDPGTLDQWHANNPNE